MEYTIKLDEEDVKAMLGLCDYALRRDGLNAYNWATKILAKLPKEEKEEKK